MRLSFDPAQAEALRAKLATFEDAEATETDEFVVDLYDADPPLSLELAFEQGGVRVLAAESLAYDEEQAGYYLAGPVEDAVQIAQALLALL